MQNFKGKVGQEELEGQEGVKQETGWKVGRSLALEGRPWSTQQLQGSTEDARAMIHAVTTWESQQGLECESRLGSLCSRDFVVTACINLGI